jgi:hypothetical protein
MASKSGRQRSSAASGPAVTMKSLRSLKRWPACILGGRLSSGRAPYHYDAITGTALTVVNFLFHAHSWTDAVAHGSPIPDRSSFLLRTDLQRS